MGEIIKMKLCILLSHNIGISNATRSSVSNCFSFLIPLVSFIPVSCFNDQSSVFVSFVIFIVAVEFGFIVGVALLDSFLLVSRIVLA